MTTGGVSVAAALIAGAAEYVMTGGTSGWVPLGAGVAGAVGGWLVTIAVVGHGRVPAQGLPSESLAGRTFVRQSPTEIVEDFRTDQTSLEIELLSKRFVGHWLEVDGVVRDVAKGPPGVAATVRLEIGSRPDIALLFSHRAPDLEAVLLLKKGLKVRARGRISSVVRTTITLKECELEVRSAETPRTIAEPPDAATRPVLPSLQEPASAAFNERGAPERGSVAATESTRPEQITRVEDRRWVRDHKAIRELQGLCRNTTSVQAEKLCAPYIGQKYFVAGTVANVLGTEGTLSVDLNIDGGGEVWLDFSRDSEWADEVERLARGDRVAAVGAISRIRLSCVTLKHAELVADGISRQPTTPSTANGQ